VAERLAGVSWPEVKDVVGEAAIGWLVGAILAFISGLLVMPCIEFVNRRHPARVLLGVNDPTHIAIVIGVPMGIIPEATVLDQTGGMPIFGFGPLMAYNHIRYLLHFGFPKVRDVSLFISRSFPFEFYSRDLVLLGFPLGNEVTRRIMSDLDIPLTFTDHEIIDTKTGASRYRATIKEGEVIRDYGLIVRVPNPYKKGANVLILAGCETYGVKAAADFLTISNLPIFKDLSWLRSGILVAMFQSIIPTSMRAEYFEIVVSTEVRGLFTSEPELETAYYKNGGEWRPSKGK
jgi:hypothetical protein